MDSYAEILEEGYLELSDEKKRKYLNFISSNAKHMQRMIQDILAFSRVGREEVELQEVNCNEVVSEVIGEFEATITQTKAHILYEGLPQIVTSPTLMRVLFQNLIGNSVKYRHPDRPLVVRMDVEERAAPAIQGEADGTIFVFRIEDNGIGFESRHCEQIFKPFERLHSAEAYDGSGLGLAICRRVIDRHGGTITAFGRPGQGAVFTFTLPQRTAFAQEKHAA